MLLEPLPVRGDQADQRDRHLADVGNHGRHVVAGALAVGVEHLIASQRIQAHGFEFYTGVCFRTYSSSMWDLTSRRRQSWHGNSLPERRARSALRSKSLGATSPTK